MPITRPNFDEVSEADVQELINASTEGLTLEFKRDMYEGNDAGRKEFLKDLSSFANSSGGHLVIGVDEIDGLAFAVTPTGNNADGTLQWLNNMAQASIQPRLVGMTMRAVPIDAGGHVFVIRIPRSWNPPHRISFQGTNRFFVRSSAGAHEADVEELRALFANGAAINDRIRTFLDDRIEKLQNNEGIVPLAQEAVAEGRLALHIVPLSAFGGGGHIDVQEAQQLAQMLRPLGAAGTNRINFDGFLTYRAGQVAHGYTQLFRDGVIEATKVGAVQTNNDVRVLPGRRVIEPLYERLPSYMQALQALSVPPPFVVSITLIGARGAVIGVGHEWEVWDQHPIDRDILRLPLQIIPAFGTDAEHRASITPALDALWNATGLATVGPYLANFNADGVWAPNG